MNAAPIRLSSAVPVDPAQVKHGANMRKLPSHNAAATPTAKRKWFAAVLWRAFPSSSERDLSHKAARVLGVTPRQVINWLRCENDAKLNEIIAVLAIAGAENIFDIIGGGKA